MPLVTITTQRCILWAMEVSVQVYLDSDDLWTITSQLQSPPTRHNAQSYQQLYGDGKDI